MKEIKFRAFQKSTQKMLPVNSLKAICTNSERLTEEEFDDLIIIQSTGLKDKNGKEIFEGDIVKFKFGRGFAQSNIIFSSGSFYVENYHRLSYWEIQKSEIIGNKYENPELLNS